MEASTKLNFIVIDEAALPETSKLMKKIIKDRDFKLFRKEYGRFTQYEKQLLRDKLGV